MNRLKGKRKDKGKLSMVKGSRSGGGGTTYREANDAHRPVFHSGSHQLLS